jgi:hypothetical protein
MDHVNVVIMDPRTKAVRLKVSADVARSVAERANGYQRVRTVAPGTGLLFVFPSIARWVFWMKDTPAPLDIVFADADGFVVGTKQLRPLDETRVVPPQPIRYALEVARGAARKVRPGDYVTISP